MLNIIFHKATALINNKIQNHESKSFKEKFEYLIIWGCHIMDGLKLIITNLRKMILVISFHMIVDEWHPLQLGKYMWFCKGYQEQKW